MTIKKTNKLTMESKGWTISGNIPPCTGPVFLYEVQGMPDNEIVQILNTRADGREPSWQIRLVGIDEGTGDYRTPEEALASLEQEINGRSKGLG